MREYVLKPSPLGICSYFFFLREAIMKWMWLPPIEFRKWIKRFRLTTIPAVVTQNYSHLSSRQLFRKDWNKAAPVFESKTQKCARIAAAFQRVTTTPVMNPTALSNQKAIEKSFTVCVIEHGIQRVLWGELDRPTARTVVALFPLCPWTTSTNCLSGMMDKGHAFVEYCIVSVSFIIRNFNIAQVGCVAPCR